MASSSPQPAEPPSTRRERAEQTRERVLEVATELMARRGYSGTSISAISKASGVMPASIYWHFESKEGLLGAVIERAAEAWFEGAARAVDRGEAEEQERGDQHPTSHRPALHYVLVEQAEFYRVLLLIALERRDAAGPPLAAVKRIRSRMRKRFIARIEARLRGRRGVTDPAQCRWIAEQLISVAMAQLDGTFFLQQLEPVEGEALAARFDHVSWVMDLTLTDLVRRAGIEFAS